MKRTLPQGQPQAFRIISILSAGTAVYRFASVLFQSLETMLSYNGVLYLPAIISGGCIAYTEYNEIKEITTSFKEKIAH